MMGQFVFRNLFHRPVRTLIGVVAIAFEVMLVIVIVGLTSGMLQETAKRIEGIGADVMVQSPGAQMFMVMGSAPMPIKIGEKIHELRYVQYVSPALLQFNTSGGVETIWGIDQVSFRDVSNGFVFYEGRDLQDPDDMLVDDWQARAKHVKLGDTYPLLNHSWKVVGIVEHGKAGRIFVLHDANDFPGMIQQRVGVAKLHMLGPGLPRSEERRVGADDVDEHPGAAYIY